MLKARLADPTADAVCETLLVAHEVGGTDLDRRLEALADDRLQDTQGRKDARAKQAGAASPGGSCSSCPLGWPSRACRSAPAGRLPDPAGQLLVVVAIALVIACWLWAGGSCSLPEEERVFDA